MLLQSTIACNIFQESLRNRAKLVKNNFDFCFCLFIDSKKMTKKKNNSDTRQQTLGRVCLQF